MSEKLKQKIEEFVALTKVCPENLQEKCFELLLSDYLQQLRPKAPEVTEIPKNQKLTSDGDVGEGEDIVDPNFQTVN